MTINYIANVALLTLNMVLFTCLSLRYIYVIDPELIDEEEQLSHDNVSIISTTIPSKPSILSNEMFLK